ncbi:hypothetical protein AB0E27_23060 [Streptomyces sparsogenes]|uniref:hypothetical protein n=1 Tax=Streptomyces sparsogenes TaxID=67365 RepID=UPI0033CEF2D9
MRTRLMLASAALGAALLTGGAVATAQAAPASLDPGNTTAAATIFDTWIYVGTYSTETACYRDGQNSAYAEWDCKKSSTGKWQLWVNIDS